MESNLRSMSWIQVPPFPRPEKWQSAYYRTLTGRWSVYDGVNRRVWNYTTILVAGKQVPVALHDDEPLIRYSEWRARPGWNGGGWW